jgi:hypothetical protein
MLKTVLVVFLTAAFIYPPQGFSSCRDQFRNPASRSFKGLRAQDINQEIFTKRPQVDSGLVRNIQELWTAWSQYKTGGYAGLAGNKRNPVTSSELHSLLQKVIRWNKKHGIDRRDSSEWRLIQEQLELASEKRGLASSYQSFLLSWKLPFQRAWNRLKKNLKVEDSEVLSKADQEFQKMFLVDRLGGRNGMMDLPEAVRENVQQIAIRLGWDHRFHAWLKKEKAVEQLLETARYGIDSNNKDFEIRFQEKLETLSAEAARELLKDLNTGSLARFLKSEYESYREYVYHNQPSSVKNLNRMMIAIGVIIAMAVWFIDKLWSRVLVPVFTFSIASDTVRNYFHTYRDAFLTQLRQKGYQVLPWQEEFRAWLLSFVNGGGADNGQGGIKVEMSKRDLKHMRAFFQGLAMVQEGKLDAERFIKRFGEDTLGNIYNILYTSVNSVMPNNLRYGRGYAFNATRDVASYVVLLTQQVMHSKGIEDELVSLLETEDLNEIISFRARLVEFRKKGISLEDRREEVLADFFAHIEKRNRFYVENLLLSLENSYHYIGATIGIMIIYFTAHPDMNTAKILANEGNYFGQLAHFWGVFDFEEQYLPYVHRFVGRLENELESRIEILQEEVEQQSILRE